MLLAALLLSTGKLADRWGRKTMFMVGLVVFAGGSLLAALSGTAGALIASRAVQALGAAFITLSTLSTVNALFRGKYRGPAFGVWGAVMSGAAAIGPLAGGALTHWASWHWIFLVNLPLAAIIAVVGWSSITNTRSDVRERGADVDGAMLSAIAFGALVFAIIEGPAIGWLTPTADFSIFGWVWPATAPVSIVAIALVVGLVALALFVVWERHRAKVRRSALLDLGLFQVRTFSWGNLAAAMVAVGEFAIIFVLPLYLTNVLGLNIMQSGLVLAAMAIGAFISGASARHLAAKFGAPGTVLIGLGLEVVGVVVLALVMGPGTAAWLVVYGVGLGLASAQLTGTVLRDVPVASSGQASATQSTVRQIGSALGTAFAGAALSVSMSLALPAALDATGLDAAQVDQLAEATRQSAGGMIPQLQAQAEQHPLGPETQHVIDALSTGFTHATQWALVIATGFILLGFLGALQVRRAARRDDTPAA